MMRWGLVLFLSMLGAAIAAAQGERTTSVGYPGRIRDHVVEGPRLEVKPQAATSPFVLRIVDIYPHGSAHRYDLEYYGLDPGEYDLLDYLQYEDGSAPQDLEPIRVTIESVLPPGQIKPHRPEAAEAAPLGGYRTLLILGAILWIVGGFALIFVGREDRRERAAQAAGKPPSLAERLRPLVEEAVAGRLQPERRAELEMTLLAYWRRRLELEQHAPAEVMGILRDHDEAGPLIRGLEDWLHRPEPPEDVDVAALLQPYERLPDERNHGERVSA